MGGCWGLVLRLFSREGADYGTTVAGQVPVRSTALPRSVPGPRPSRYGRAAVTGTLAGMGTQYESWVERQIREAQERGEFDNLPGAGKPLDFLDRPPDEDWWVKGLIERERLDVTAALPPQLALRKEAQALPGRLLQERTEQAVREQAEDFNARVRELWRRPVEGPLVVVRTVDVEKLVAQWRTYRTEHPPVASAPPQPARTGGTVPRLKHALARLRRSSRRNG